MKILRSPQELREIRRNLKTNGSLPQKIGFVPTMGALHLGHRSLVERSVNDCDLTIASIFVNPTQFGPNEDLAKYPRTLDADLSLLEGAQCDFLFLPEVSDIYPIGFSTFVEETEVSKPLCGAFRPGHFRGVATVVLKLFNLCQPDVAYFGQKDAQQCAVIEKMVRDLGVDIALERVPTLREVDGLAMSSRNRYLSTEDRHEATVIYRSYLEVKKAIASGIQDSVELTEIALATLASAPNFKIQYCEIRDQSSLQPVIKIRAQATQHPLLFVAGYLGSTRLIDNFDLTPHN